jgi:hypothetical protein
MSEPDDDKAPPSAEPAPATTGADGPTPVTIACGCRRGLNDASVISEPRYSWWATATLLFGVTAPPKAVEFQCLKCRKVIATATDRETIRRFTQ